MVLIGLYWLSGLALVVEPFRWWARSRRSSVPSWRPPVEQEALLRAQRSYAEQAAWAQHERAMTEWERRNREAHAAAEAHRLSRPVPCRYCRNPVAGTDDQCGHCGARKEAV